MPLAQHPHQNSLNENLSSITHQPIPNDKPIAAKNLSGLDWFKKNQSKYPDSSNEIKTPRHGKGYNVLFCDGHVELVPRQILFDPRKSAEIWNNDHLPHQETWFGN